MREQLAKLEQSRQALRAIYDAEDITVSEYPSVLGQLTFGIAGMASFQNDSAKFSVWLNLALSSAEEIMKPTKQDYYAFTNDSWYKRNGCHDIIKSMLSILTEISNSLGTDASSDIDTNKRSSSPPKLSVY